MLLMTVLAARQVRLRFSLSNGSLLALAVVGVLIVGLRHNGVLIAPPFFLLLLYLARGRAARTKVGVVLGLQVAAFVLFKTVALSALAATGIGAHYKAIYALHVLGAMENANVQWEGQDRQLITQTLPKDAWVKGYRCENVVPLFWNADVSYEFLAAHHSELNVLALKSIIRHPRIFLKHQLCLSGLVWRIGTNENEWMTLSPLTIYILARENTLLRPALYVFLGLFAVAIITVRKGKSAILMAIPLGFNCLSLLIMVGSQDYRYMWPSVVTSLFIILLGIALAFPRSGVADVAAVKA
jgi:hypothetical protein